MRIAAFVGSAAAALALGSATVPPAAAAGSNTLAGTVTDTAGKAVVGATMTLLRSDTPTGTYTPVTGGTATTGKKGHYAFSVNDGFYKVSAAKKDCYAPNSYSSSTNTVTPEATSGVHQVPPSATGIRLTLDCTNIPPVASFTAPPLAKPGAAVAFDATSSHDANGSIASYHWDFGDGATRTTSAPTVTHAYPVTATFTPRLRVVDDQGVSGSVTGGAVSVGDVPGQVTNFAATSGPTSVTLNWSAPVSNNSPITGYTIDVSPPRPSQTTTATTTTINGLDPNTSYTFSVHATNGFGDSPVSKTSGTASPSSAKPTVLISKAPTGYTTATSGSLSFTVNPPTGATITSTTCRVDDQAPQACTPGTAFPFAGLAAGSHTVVVTATDSTNSIGSASTQWVVDQTAPTAATLTPAVLTTVARKIHVRWGGADANGVALFDVRYRKAAWNRGFGGQISWRPITAETAATLRGALGTEYCFSARARDAAGNTSGWSAQRCTALPLDDRALTAHGSWTPLKAKRFYNGTAMRTTTPGASLALTGVVAGRAALVVERGKGYGSLVVRYNGKTVKTVSLRAGSRQDRVVIALPRVPKSKGKTTVTVVAKTATAKKPVVVDGLLLARI